MVLAEDIIFAVRDLLNNDKGNLNFSPSAHYAVQKLIDYAEQLQRIWREVEALSESVRDGYVSAPDLIRVLREEYEIDIVGG